MNLIKKQPSYLGVDIGSSGIKVVELTKKDRVPQLVTYGYSEESTDIVKASSETTQTKNAAVLKAICDKARVGTKKAMAALPNYLVFSSIINLPSNIEKSGLESSVKWEAKKFIPIPLEEVALDWRILGPKENSVNQIISNAADESPDLQAADYPIPENQASPETNPPLLEAENQGPSKNNGQTTVKKKSNQESPGSLNILLTAAPKNLVKKYIDVCKIAGLELLSLETESFALSRSLVGLTPNPLMIIDMGALVSDIVVMDKAVPVLSRSIDVGGQTITQSIMNILNVDFNRAEQFKRDFGAPKGPSPNQFIGLKGPHIGSGPQAVPRAISAVLDSLMHEIKYSINLYQNQTQKKVEKVVLSGGSAFLPNFTDYLSQTLSLPVFVGNPWDRISYPTELKPVLDNLAPRFAVALGLALREII